MGDPTQGHVEQGGDAGGVDGQATFVEQVVERAAPRGGRPGATAVLDELGAKVVAFEFDTDDVLGDHAARHPVLIQVLRGRVEFTLPDRVVEIVPGQVLHLTAMLRHSVRALEPTTLTVTMLLPH